MAKKAAQKTAPKRRADQYNDPKHNYLHYWDGREYEHAAEEVAISKLLKGRHFRNAVDVGGGYGRLCVQLEHYADKVTLAEPSQQQLDIAREFLKDHPEIDRKLAQADDLPFEEGSIDLLTMIRVMHHLPDPSAEFHEISRVLADDGFASVRLKKIMPREVMLGAERMLQRPLAMVYFGPSIFFLVRKANSA
jgi:ubiquinone/menaquinone biosynthesis C-methylase UbiE